jgi:hypothetical protein
MIRAVVRSLELREVRGHGQPEEVLRVDLGILAAALDREPPALRQSVQLYVIQVYLSTSVSKVNGHTWTMALRDAARGCIIFIYFFFFFLCFG